MRVWLLVFLVLLPFASAATLQGVVMDDLGNLVRGAELKVSCAGPVDAPETTDKFGSFTANVSMGTCRVFATHQGNSGSVLINITADFQDVELLINSRGSAVSLTLIILLALILSGFAAWKFWPRKKKADTSYDAVLSVLPEKERDIVNYLLAQGKTCWNANIRHALNLPRTSMKRLLESLESKQMVTLEKHGKAMRVSLTERFEKSKPEQK